MKHKNRPQGIALEKVAVRVGPARVAEFHGCASAVYRRQLELGDGAKGVAWSDQALPFNRARVRFENLPFEGGPVMGMRSC
jgi:hypothetical protein